MPRLLITASSVLSLAACVASPGLQGTPAAGSDKTTLSATPLLATPAPHHGLTTLTSGEEEDGSGTVITTMAIGEEDGPPPAVTTLAHGEEEDGSGTMISTLAVGEEDGDPPPVLPNPPVVPDPPAPQSFLGEQLRSHQITSVAEIMTRLRRSEG